VTEARRTEVERPLPRDVRPIRETKEVKTCISVKYRKYRIRALVDTGSDVSIAGEDVAWKFRWRIENHETKIVHVANSEQMAVIGAAYATLRHFV